MKPKNVIHKNKQEENIKQTYNSGVYKRLVNL
jgi:hypothetical protein